MRHNLDLTVDEPCGSHADLRARLAVLIIGAFVLTGIVLGGQTVAARAQESTQSLRNDESALADSSDLSSALSAREWVRVEQSVDRGLEWLASQQAADGRFPSNPIGQPAVTSLAVMAFLSRGHIPGHGKYGEQLDRAIDFVLAQQSRRGYFSLLPISLPDGHLKPPQTLLYNHTISGLMLGEVYGMTSPADAQRIEAAIAKALVFTRSVQAREKATPAEAGGWRYAYPDSPRANSDLSVTGWALMFYRSARNAEFEVPKEYFDEGLDFVERCYTTDPAMCREGVFLYRPLETNDAPKPSLANTGSALLTLILGGRHESDMVRQATAWYIERDYPSPTGAGHFYLSCYYSSQAMAQVGGAAWKQVYPQIALTLIQEQQPEGHWPAGRSNETSFGTTYSTSMSILALTPPYQFLPIYQR